LEVLSHAPERGPIIPILDIETQFEKRISLCFAADGHPHAFLAHDE